MNRHFGCAVFFSLLLPSYSALAQQMRPSVPAYVADQVIVAFEPGTSAVAIADAHRQATASPLRNFNAIGAVLVRTGRRSVSSVVTSYMQNPNVRYAEPNYLRVMIIPNEGQDPPPPFGLGIDYFAEQYGLHNTGQNFYYDQFTGQPGAITASAGADIDAPEAWDLHTGSAITTVAVLDTGVECGHLDLIGKCAVANVNLGQSATADDELGHGTLVASVIGANSNNDIGIAGVNWGTSLASVKVCYEVFDIFFGLLGFCDAAASAAGMIHAADNGYQVVNMSYAGPEGSQAEADAAAYAWSKGVVLVAAAANNYSRLPMYPAAFPEVIGVAATDWFDNLAGFSNFGPSWVSLAAPGAKLFVAFPHWACGLADTDPWDCYGWADGTSFSSPMVAGAAALVWSYIGAGATNALVRSALEAGGDAVGTHGQNILAWTKFGRLNLLGALNASAGVTPPPASVGVHVGDLDASRLKNGPAWSPQVTIQVHDETEALVGGGFVTGKWSDTSVGECSISDGQCQISGNLTPNRTASVEFTVTGVIVNGSNYSSVDNHDPEIDSDGTSITVSK